MRTLRALGRILGISFGASRRLCVATVAILITSVLSGAVVAISLKLLVDAAVTHDTGRAVTGGVLGTVALAASVAWLPIGGLISLTMQERIGAHLDRRLMTLAARIPSLDLHDSDEYAGKLQLMMDDDRRPIAGGLIVIVSVTAYVALLLGTSALLAVQHPLLAIVPLAMVPVLWLGWRGDRMWEQARRSTAVDQQVSQELFRLATTPEAGKELRVFDLGAELLTRYEAAQRRITTTLDRASWRASLVRAASWLVFAAGYALSVLVVAERAAQGRATAGDVILVITLGLAIVLLAGSAGPYVSVLTQLTAAGDRLLWLEEKAAESLGGAFPAPPRLQRGIRLENVAFSYAGSDRPALSDVDLLLPAGGVVAFVGDNGAGKSTLVKLLCGLYSPTAGRVTVDDVDLREISTDEWRPRICSGFQDFVQFEFVARESIGVGDLPRSTDDAAVDTAVERGGAHDVVAVLDRGLDTQLGRSWADGAELSTGQWQKVALSRALMRDDPLLVVLDEPTAALDPSAEHRLFERFSQASESGRARGAVTVLVSHRFSTVRFADLIVVVDAGRVVQVGSHEDLMRRGGMYAELYELQRANYS